METLLENTFSFGVEKEEIERKTWNLLSFFAGMTYLPSWFLERWIQKNFKITIVYAKKFMKPHPNLYTKLNLSI